MVGRLLRFEARSIFRRYVSSREASFQYDLFGEYTPENLTWNLKKSPLLKGKFIFHLPNLHCFWWFQPCESSSRHVFTFDWSCRHLPGQWQQATKLYGFQQVQNSPIQWTNGTGPSRFILTYYLWLHVREPKTAPGCLLPIFWWFVGKPSIWTVGSNGKTMVPHLSLYASCGFAVYVIPICYVFFFHWIISGRFVNGTQTARQFHGERGPQAPWPPVRPVVLGGQLRWCHQRCRKVIQVGHSCEFVEHVSWHSHMRVVGTIGAKFPKENNLNMNCLAGERLLLAQLVF